jgi:uncharacterized membrane protein
MIRSSIIIGAPAAEVWKLTIDVERWPELTPTVRRVQRLDDGPLRMGSRATVEQPAQRHATWTVTRFDPEREFVWATKVLTVTMVGGHRIEPTADGCRNTLTLELSGFGSGLLERLLRKKLRAALATENAGFKRKAESAPASDH